MKIKAREDINFIPWIYIGYLYCVILYLLHPRVDMVFIFAGLCELDKAKIKSHNIDVIIISCISKLKHIEMFLKEFIDLFFSIDDAT